MRQEFLIAGGAILLVLAIISGAMVLNSPPSDPANETDGGPSLANPEEPETETATPEEPAPIFNADDPGNVFYPRNPSSASEVRVSSEEISDQIYKQINTRRAEDDLPKMYSSATVISTTRTHSWDMYNRSYFNSTSPDGVTPVDRYEEMKTECTDVQEYIFRDSITVITAEGDKPHVSSGGIAADIFMQMLHDDEMKETMLSSEYQYVSGGTYIAPETEDDGSTTLNVFVTVDYCTTR